MNKMSLKKIAGLIAMLCLLISVQAQEYNDAAIMYNKGVAKFSTDVDSAIFLFEECLKICEAVGDTAFEIETKVIQVLPDLYYQKAFNYLTIDKDVNLALKTSKHAMALANKYEDDATREKTEKLMIQAYSTMGATYFSSDQSDKALAAFDSVLAINPDHLAAIYNKSLTYKKQNNTAKYAETIDLYLEKLKASGDEEKAATTSKSALEYFRGLASKANKANNLPEAINLLGIASKYGENADVYYYYANIYNKQKKYADAITSAQKGIALETGTPEDKAKFYYELGVAQAGKGETTNACESFKNSMYGPFLEASKGQRTNLKCK